MRQRTGFALQMRNLFSGRNKGERKVMKNRKKFLYYRTCSCSPSVCVAVIAAAMILGVPDKVSAAQAGKQIDLGNKYLAAADYDKAEVTFCKKH